MATRIVPLGTNGFIPTQGRQTMSFLLLIEDQAIILDAGSGIARLLEEPAVGLLGAYSSLSIILSHYHLDHVVGLTYLTAIWRGKPLTIYAPVRPLVEAEGDVLQNLLQPPYFPVTLPNYPAPVTVVPYATETLRIGPVSVRLRRQKHDGGSVGMRFGNDLAYTTDTVIDDGTSDFVRGARLLLHELWLDDADAPAAEATRTGHSYASGVVRLVNEAKVSSLMIVHHHPLRPTAGLQRTAQAAQAQTKANVILPEEGTVYEV